MQSLSQYIFEHIITESVSSDLKDLRKAFKATFKSMFGVNVSPKSGAHHEIFRYSFSSSEDAVKMIKTALENISGATLKSETPKIAGRMAGSSGTFFSYVIEYNGEEYYICDNNAKNSKSVSLKKKSLAPNALGLGNKKFNSFKSLYDATVAGLKQNKNIEENVLNFIYSVFDKLSDTKNMNLSGSFNAQSFDEYINNTNKGIVDVDIDNLDINNILDTDLNCIECDLGEVIGPMLFLTVFPDTEVYFPSASNEPLVDYFINGYKFSAKQLSGGGNPAGTDLMRSAKNIQLANIENKIDAMSAKQQDIIFTDTEQQFINDIAETFDLSIFQQQAVLIDKFYKQKDSGIKKLLSFLDLPSYSTYKDMVKDMDNYFNNDKQKIISFFADLYSICNYRLKEQVDGTVFTPEVISEKYDTLETKLKYGLLFYPMWKNTINNINTTYKDEITSVFNKVINMKQVYFGFKNDYMKFNIVSSAVSNWEFTTGGMSTANITNSKLSVRLKK